MEWYRVALLFVCATSVLSKEVRKFPDKFKFGVATASYQIEGAWNASGKGENIWDRLTHTTNYVDNGDTGDVACDSYNKYKRDVEMLVELGVDFYRFSLSWSRILPNGFTDEVSLDGLNYYNNLINELLAKGIQPVVTLYHWDLPQNLQDIGGWANPILADYFSDYANIAFNVFGDRVKYWLTFNEPSVICTMGYGFKEVAPALGMSGIGDYLCAHTLVRAHAKAYHLYDEKYRATQHGKVSLTVNSFWYEPKTDTPKDLEASERAMQFSLGLYCHPIFTKEGDFPKIMKDRIAAISSRQYFGSSRLPKFTPEEVAYIRGTYDFFGLNHYTTQIVTTLPDDAEIASPSIFEDAGVFGYQDPSWPGGKSSWLKVVPWGLRKLLNWIKKNYNKPETIIFENGYSDDGTLEDTERINYYHQYLNAVLDAIEDGCKVTGYTSWSLMDNFEWMRGYSEKFGLYHVDFNDPERTRTPKQSAFYYKEIVKSRTIQNDPNGHVVNPSHTEL